jgi:hypothetical protein
MPYHDHQPRQRLDAFSLPDVRTAASQVQRARPGEHTQGIAPGARNPGTAPPDAAAVPSPAIEAAGACFTIGLFLLAAVTEWPQALVAWLIGGAW